MATQVTDEMLINKLASIERGISGVKKAYDFAENPDNLTNQVLPAALHYPIGFDSEQAAHFNVWRNALQMRTVLFVAPRQDKGGTLKFLENDAMPFLYKWRKEFQLETNVRDLLSLGLVKAFISRGRYGAGNAASAAGQALIFNGIPYIGCIFDFDFVEKQ